MGKFSMFQVMPALLMHVLGLTFLSVLRPHDHACIRSTNLTKLVAKRQVLK